MQSILPKIRGQVIIGIIIALGILAILTQTIITLVFTSYDLLNYTAARTTAKHIATEQIEIIRNLPYIDVGTVGGIPTGVLPQTQNTVRNGLTYNIITSIVYVDDPFDQLAPTDILPTDYKRVRVDVSWGGLAASKTAPITLVSDIAPKGVETTTGGGTLSILVFDSAGIPISQADVVISAATNPAVNVTLKTDSDGRVLLPGAPACSNSCYSITVSKASYSTDKTYSTAQVTNPLKPNQNVLAGKLTQVGFAIDIISSLNVISTTGRDTNFSSLGNQHFTLRSDKTIGTDGTDNPVYKYSQNLTTSIDGTLTIPDLEWGTYQFTPTDGALYDTSGTNPLLPITIIPNSTQQFTYASVPHSDNSLLSMFLNPENSPIASVSAQLSDSGIAIATISAGLETDPDFGQTFFGNLLSKQYQLDATVSGYTPYSAVIDVIGKTINNVILTPQ